MQELQNLVNQFESSFNFYILRNTYDSSIASKNFIDKYLAIKNHTWKDEVKYAKLSELIKESMKATLTTMRSIKKINNLWEPDFKSIKQNTEYYKNNVSIRSKTACEAIQQLFENPEIRKNLSNDELYSLYEGYYQISNYIKNKTLTDEILIDIETKLRPISDKIWTLSITKPENFKPGEPFMFIVHNASKSEIITTKLNDEHTTRRDRMSASLITDKEMGVYGKNKYGFIFPDDTRMVTSGYRDLQSYETQKEGNFFINSNNSMLIPPQAIESYLVDLNIKENGRRLNDDNARIYNEILLDTTSLKPVGIYCITFGEKELSRDYRLAKKLAEQSELPLIDIDISLYRTKGNKGTYLIDEEALSVKEQRLFAEKFLKQYYKSKNYDLATEGKFIEADLKLYQDVIIDIFLTQKKENNVSPENLFKLFEEAKKTRKNKAENYNTYINEMSDLKEVLSNFNQALSICNNEIIRNSIIEQSNEIIKRMKVLNKLIENTNSIGLSVDNWIYQSNIVAKKIIGDFTPFNTEIIEFNGEKITIISGYKSKQELEQTKQEMLKQVDLSRDPMQRRLEHAKRVIEVKFNAYETNSVNIDFATYKQTTPELDQLKITSHSFIDISSLDKDITKYDRLVALQQQLATEIQTLSDNMKVYDGASRIEWLEQEQKESATKIETYRNSITSNEQELILLHQHQDELLKEKAELDKKGFFGKMFAGKRINENTTNLSDLKEQIKILERKVSTTKENIEYEEKYIKQITDSFLSSFGLSGMSLEDYKKRLATIITNAEKLTDPFAQKELEEKLKKVEQKISEMQIDKQKEQQMRQALEQKKIEVGLSTSQSIITETPEEFEFDKKTGISK